MSEVVDMCDILTFTKPETRWLSNMTYVYIVYKGITYPSTENFYQAMKYESNDTRLLISRLKPQEAKKYSRENKMTSVLFEKNKIAIMRYAQFQKFSKEPFKSKLLATTGLIEEGNWWGDKFWGVDINTRDGENNLGKIIMEVRGDLKWYKANNEV